MYINTYVHFLHTQEYQPTAQPLILTIMLQHNTYIIKISNKINIVTVLQSNASLIIVRRNKVWI
jgi:hypothetical protein